MFVRNLNPKWNERMQVMKGLGFARIVGVLCLHSRRSVRSMLVPSLSFIPKHAHTLNVSRKSKLPKPSTLNLKPSTLNPQPEFLNAGALSQLFRASQATVKKELPASATGQP